MLISFYDKTASSPKCLTRVHWPFLPNKGDSVCIDEKNYYVVMVQHNVDLERIQVLMESWGE